MVGDDRTKTGVRASSEAVVAIQPAKGVSVHPRLVPVVDPRCLTVQLSQERAGLPVGVTVGRRRGTVRQDTGQVLDREDVESRSARSRCPTGVRPATAR